MKCTDAEDIVVEFLQLYPSLIAIFLIYDLENYSSETSIRVGSGLALWEVRSP